MSTTVRPTALDAPIADTAAPPTKNRRTKTASRPWIILIVFAVAALAAWEGLSRLSPTVRGTKAAIFTVDQRSFPVIESVKGELSAAQTTEIKSKVEGRATIIWLIKEGETVAEGDLLVKLASDKIEERIQQEEANEASAIAALEAAEKDHEILVDQNASNIRKAELAVEMAEIEKRKYIEGDAEKSLVDAQLELARTKQQLERSKLDFEAAQSLHDQKFITDSEFLGDEFELEESKRALEKAKLSLLIFNKYEKPKELRKRESDLNEARKELERVKKSALAQEAQKLADVEAKRAKLLNTKTQLKKYREQLKFCEIRAPAPGLVVYFTGSRYNPQKIEEGSEVFERQTIVTLPDTSQMLVNVRIHEAKTHKIKIGQHVNVEVDAIPDRVFTGKISKIAPLADSRNQWLNPDLKEYQTEITLEEHDPALKPGVTARAEIIISQEEDVTCVPLQAVYSKSGYHYVFRDNGEAAEVTLGASSDELVAVASGLSVGDRVLLTVSDIAKASLPDREPKQLTAAIAGAVHGKPGDAHAKPVADRGKKRHAKPGGQRHGHKRRGDS